MADTNIQTRLDSIEQQIAEFRHKLDLKGIMNADRKVTEAELRERLKVLRNRLARQGDHAGMHREADALDLAFNRWVDGTDMEYKS